MGGDGLMGSFQALPLIRSRSEPQHHMHICLEATSVPEKMPNINLGLRLVSQQRWMDG